MGLCLSLTMTMQVCRAAGPWYYEIGKTVEGQQANLCRSEADALEVAEIFETRGARPGYTALDYNENCNLTVIPFTPEDVLIEVIIEQGQSNEYSIRFVKVRTDDDETRYLVTTRQVALPRQ